MERGGDGEGGRSGKDRGICVICLGVDATEVLLLVYHVQSLHCESHLADIFHLFYKVQSKCCNCR